MSDVSVLLVEGPAALEESLLVDVIYRSTRLGDKTKAAYEACVRRFLGFAGVEPQRWSGLVVEEWRDALAGEIGPRTVNKHLYALRYASSRLEALGLGRDFARVAETMREPTVRRKAMSEEEVQALMNTCDRGRPSDVRDLALMTLALTTALRSDNVQSIRFEDFDGRRLHVIQKGEKSHSPVLDDRSIHRLDIWKDVLAAAGVEPKGRVFRRISRERLDGTYIIGKPIQRRAWFNDMVDARAKLAGIRRKIHPHLFRHTCISWLLERGVAPSRVMGQSGHASMATLSQYVTDLQAEGDPIGGYLPEF